MARKKLSEFRAKSLLYAGLGQKYAGVEIDAAGNWQKAVSGLGARQKYVIKVDQAEKGRFKKGLVKLDRSKTELTGDVKKFISAGYRYLLVEPYQPHETSEERYLSIELTREGLRVSYSKSGGIDIEAQAGSIKSFVYKGSVPSDVDLPKEILERLIKVFDDSYLSFLEINPLLIKNGQPLLLDAAVEADGEADFFTDGWDETDLRSPRSHLTPEELAVKDLAAKSQASFSLEVINPNGAIFLLLSGGGASVVVADEVFNLGYGKELANYGEYSGNPNPEETRHYTEQIVQLLLKSTAKNKVLIIGGGVANFTDVRATFKGVVAALQPHDKKLKQQGVKVYVRRGGPHEKEGLAAMREYLEGAGIAGHVAGPEMMLSDIVGLAVKGRKA